MVQIWRCRVCGRTASRANWGTYKGLLSCSTCLVAAYVGTLEPVEGCLEIYYFGCWHGAGHYLHDTQGRTIWRDESTGLPFPSRTLDTGFLPKPEPGRSAEQPEGVVHLTHHKGWTVIAFWDRSVDTRTGCNSAFAIEGEHAKDEALRLAREAFPTVFARFKFEVA